VVVVLPRMPPFVGAASPEITMASRSRPWPLAGLVGPERRRKREEKGEWAGPVSWVGERGEVRAVGPARPEGEKEGPQAEMKFCFSFFSKNIK
jgi:hypothetical protein